MKATVMYGAHDVRVETVPDARLVEPTDALVRVTRASICGSDLWPYNSMAPSETGNRMGHEFIGVVEAVGSAVRTVKKGDLVVAPFAWSDGTCEFCQNGLQTSCLHGGWWGGTKLDGGQGEGRADPAGRRNARRASRRSGPRADAVAPDAVGRHGHGPPCRARREGEPGKVVAVVGDGAVGLCGVIAARRLGAEQIIMLGRHADRIALAREFGATEIVSERGDAAIERVRELTGGLGAHSVLECVGHGESMRTAVSIARAGGAVGRVGVPQETTIPNARPTFYKNITIAGGPAPVRAYIEQLLPDVLEGTIEPGRVFDRVTNIDGVPDGYRAMNEREAIKVMIEF